MATMRIKYLATSIMMQMHLEMFIPEKVFLDPEGEEAKRLKVLWLLHKGGGDASDYFRLSMAEHFAEKNNVALIIPNMDNSLYMDMAHGAYPYFIYMTKELPQYLRSLLTFLPSEREQNFVAGVEEGGYGAVKWALTEPSFFAGCASLSGELDIAGAMQEKNREGKVPELWAAAFGDESFVSGNGNDLMYLLEKATGSHDALPEIYLANTIHDDSYMRNKAAADRIHALGINLRYDFSNTPPGWNFWNDRLGSYIESIARKGGI